MKTGSWIVAASSIVIVTAATAPAAAQQPYAGYWADNAASCRNEDSAGRMSIEGNVFQWYETRCRASDVRASGSGAWTMRMSCEGEGQRFQARPTVSLPNPDRLVIANSPVGPGKRQSYIRCIKR